MSFKAQGIFIPFNTPSSKNSKRMIIKKGQRPLLIHSKTVMKYQKNTKLYWMEKKDEFLFLSKDMKKPLLIGFHFIRGSRHKFDVINMLQIVQDSLVTYKWIDDDNADELIPLFFKMKGQYYTYDKENPGCWIVPLNNKLLQDLKNYKND